MNLFKEFLGVVGFKFKIGGDRGTALQTDQSALTDQAKILKIRNSDDSAFNIARASNIKNNTAIAPSNNDLVTLFDLQSRLADVQFSFGSSADLSSSSGSFKGSKGQGHIGFSVSSDGGFLTKRLYYDKGTTWVGGQSTTFGVSHDLADLVRFYEIPFEVGAALTTRTGITNIYLDEPDWLFVWSGTDWIKKCFLPITSLAGQLSILSVPFAYNSDDPNYGDLSVSPHSVQSSIAVPDTAVIIRTIIEIINKWKSDSPEFQLSVAVGSNTLMTTNNSDFDDLEDDMQFDNDEIQLLGGSGGHLIVSSSETSGYSEGKGIAYVIYGIPLV